MRGRGWEQQGGGSYLKGRGDPLPRPSHCFAGSLGLREPVYALRFLHVLALGFPCASPQLLRDQVHCRTSVTTGGRF